MKITLLTLSLLSLVSIPAAFAQAVNPNEPLSGSTECSPLTAAIKIGDDRHEALAIEGSELQFEIGGAVTAEDRARIQTRIDEITSALEALSISLSHLRLTAQVDYINQTITRLGGYSNITPSLTSVMPYFQLAARLHTCAQLQGMSTVGWLRDNPPARYAAEEARNWAFGDQSLRLADEIRSRAIDAWIATSSRTNDIDSDTHRDQGDASVRSNLGNVLLAQITAQSRTLRVVSSQILAEIRERIPTTGEVPAEQSRLIQNQFHTLEVVQGEFLNTMHTLLESLTTCEANL
jgi:hypothetical protein